MIIAMAGLPGTGKSTLSQALAKIVKGIVLDKDIVRAAMFPHEWIDFSNIQDDLCLEIMLMVAKYIIEKDRKAIIIIDGRTFSRSYQLEYLKKYAEKIGTELELIECICSDAIIKSRLAEDREKHIAKNRNFELYLQLKNAADPISPPKLTVDTGKMNTQECLREMFSFLNLQYDFEYTSFKG